MIHTLTIAGIEFEQHRAFRSKKYVWHTPDRRVSIYHMGRDEIFSVSVDKEMLPRDYKTLAGAVRAAKKVMEQPK